LDGKAYYDTIIEKVEFEQAGNWQGYPRWRVRVTNEEEPNRIKNSGVGVEDPDVPGKPDAWTPEGVGAIWYEGGYGSPKALQLKPQGASCYWYSDPILIEAGLRHYLSCVVKGDPDTTFKLSVKWYLDIEGESFIDESEVSLAGNWENWKEVLETVVSPTGARTGRIYFKCGDSAHSCLGDNFAFYPREMKIFPAEADKEIAPDDIEVVIPQGSDFSIDIRSTNGNDLNEPMIRVKKAFIREEM
jgi:hypothetical protein